MEVTGLITIEEAKAYLRIDGNEEDNLIARLIASSERLCLDTLRKDAPDGGPWLDFSANINPLTLRKEAPEETAAFKMAVLFSVAYLYEYREDADYHNLLLTLRSLLFGERKEAF